MVKVGRDLAKVGGDNTPPFFSDGTHPPTEKNDGRAAAAAQSRGGSRR